MNKLLLSVVALAVAIPAMAQVQASQAKVAPVAQAPRMDMTHTRDQMVAMVRDHFAKMDTNRDGFIAADEMKAMRAQHQGMRGNRQAMRDPAAMFDLLDANRDGAISRDEFVKGHEMHKNRRSAVQGQTAAPGTPGAMHHKGRRGMKMGGMGGMGGGWMFKMADLDKDGRVSLQEATTAALQHFDQVDTNRDGRITPEERKSYHDKRKQMRAPKAG